MSGLTTTTTTGSESDFEEDLLEDIELLDNQPDLDKQDEDLLDLEDLDQNMRTPRKGKVRKVIKNKGDKAEKMTKDGTPTPDEKAAHD